MRQLWWDIDAGKSLAFRRFDGASALPILPWVPQVIIARGKVTC